MVVSALIEAELLVRPQRANDTEAIEKIAGLLAEDGIRVVNVDRRIARRAARLRAQKRLGLADAIIIATAIEAGCDAVVGNDRQWLSLSEISFILLDEAGKKMSSETNRSS